MKNTTTEKIIKVISPDETFRGLSYGEWIIPYMNWLVSDAPDVYTNDNILYLRGSVRGQSYRSSTDRPIGSRAFLRDDRVILDKTGSYGYAITMDTAVMFTPLFSFYSSNLKYKGKIIESESEIHNACVLEMNNSSIMFANLYDISNINSRENPSNKQSQGKQTRSIELFDNDKDTTSFLVESPIFNLYIPEDSLLADQFDVPLERGKEYTKTIVYGSFIIIQFTKPGKYQLDFGGIGQDSYGTRSIYDIEVLENIRPRIKDISEKMRIGPRRSPSEFKSGSDSERELLPFEV